MAEQTGVLSGVSVIKTVAQAGWARWLRRLAFVLAYCLLSNLAIHLVLPDRRFARDYRPEWYELPRYVRFIHDYHRRHPDQPIIIFAGPSTSWGMGARPGKGFPERFARILRERYPRGPLARAKIFNVSLVGNNSATDYYTLRALSGVADAVYLQIHYAAFSFRDQLHLKPELVVGLGQWPSERERMALGGEWVQNARNWGWDTAISIWLCRHLPLYRDRIALRHHLYQDVSNPAEYLYDSYENWMEATGRERRERAARRLREACYDRELFKVGVTQRWEQLSTGARDWFRKMTGWRFQGVPIRANNRNFTFLKLTVSDLQRRRVPLFVYTAKINVSLLEREGLWDQALYDRNQPVLARYFAAHAVPYVDYNDRPVLPERYFHDYAHLLDPGAAWQAEQLFRDSRGFLEKIGR